MEVKTFDITLAEELSLIPLPLGWDRIEEEGGQVYYQDKSGSRLFEHPLLHEARVQAESLPLPPGWSTQEMVLSDESSRPYYIYDPYERGISDSESLPAYLWYTSAVGGWDHPLVRFIVADILASSGMTEQSTALLEIPPHDLAEMEGWEPGDLQSRPPPGSVHGAADQAAGLSSQSVELLIEDEEGVDYPAPKSSGSPGQRPGVRFSPGGHTEHGRDRHQQPSPGRANSAKRGAVSSPQKPFVHRDPSAVPHYASPRRKAPRHPSPQRGGKEDLPPADLPSLDLLCWQVRDGNLRKHELMARVRAPSGGRVLQMVQSAGGPRDARGKEDGRAPASPLSRSSPLYLLSFADLVGHAQSQPLLLVQALFLSPDMPDHRRKLCRFLLHKLYHPLSTDPAAPSPLLKAAVALQARMNREEASKRTRPRPAALFLTGPIGAAWDANRAPLSVALLQGHASGGDAASCPSTTLLADVLVAYSQRYDVMHCMRALLLPVLQPAFEKKTRWSVAEAYTFACRVLDVFMSAQSEQTLPCSVRAVCRHLLKEGGEAAVDIFLLDFLLLPALSHLVLSTEDDSHDHALGAGAAGGGGGWDPQAASYTAWTQGGKETSLATVVWVTWRLFRWASAVSRGGKLDMHSHLSPRARKRQQQQEGRRAGLGLLNLAGRRRSIISFQPSRTNKSTSQSTWSIKRPAPAEPDSQQAWLLEDHVPTARLQSACDRYRLRLLGFREWLTGGAQASPRSRDVSPGRQQEAPTTTPRELRELMVVSLSDLKYLARTLSRLLDSSRPQSDPALSQCLLDYDNALSLYEEDMERERLPDNAHLFLLLVSWDPDTPRTEGDQQTEPARRRKALSSALERLGVDTRVLTAAIEHKAQQHPRQPVFRLGKPTRGQQAADDGRPRIGQRSGHVTQPVGHGSPRGFEQAVEGEEVVSDMQQLRELCLNEPRQWDYKPIKPGWRMSHDDWDRLFLANLRRPWPQHITARQERGRVMNADSDVQRQKALLPRLSTFPGPRSQRGKRPASSGMQRTMASTFFGRQRPCSPQFQAYEESISALTGERASEAELHTLPPTLLQAGHGNWASPTRPDRHQQLLSTLHGMRQGQGQDAVSATGGAADVSGGRQEELRGFASDIQSVLGVLRRQQQPGGGGIFGALQARARSERRTEAAAAPVQDQTEASVELTIQEDTDGVVLWEEPLTPGRALLLSEGIDLSCLSRHLDLEPRQAADAPQSPAAEGLTAQERAGENVTVDSSPAAPATAEPSSESASPGKSRRRSSLSFWPRPRRASLEQEGSAQQAPPAPPQQQLEVPDQRVASNRRGSQQCQPVAEPDQATTTVTPASQTVDGTPARSSTSGARSRAEPSGRCGSGDEPMSPPRAAEAAGQSSLGADMMVTPGGSVRKRSENWPVRGAVGGNPEAFTYEELFRGLEVIKYKRLGRKENRLLFLDPHTQDVFLWRPPGIFNRAKVKRAFSVADIRDVVKGGRAADAGGKGYSSPITRLLKGSPRGSPRAQREEVKEAAVVTVVTGERAVVMEMEDGVTRDILLETLGVLRQMQKQKLQGRELQQEEKVVMTAEEG